MVCIHRRRCTRCGWTSCSRYPGRRCPLRSDKQPFLGEEMKIQRMWSVAVATLLVSSAPAVAQTQRITFTDAITIALRQNLTVRQAENTVENNRLAVSQAGQS